MKTKIFVEGYGNAIVKFSYSNIYAVLKLNSNLTPQKSPGRVEFLLDATELRDIIIALEDVHAAMTR